MLQSLLSNPTFQALGAALVMLGASMLYWWLTVPSRETLPPARQLAERAAGLQMNPQADVDPADETRWELDRLREEINQAGEAGSIYDSGIVKLDDKIAQVEELEELLEMIRQWDEV